MSLYKFSKNPVNLRSLLWIFALLSFSQQALATVSEVNILGASNVVVSGTTINVYGGIGGSDTNCTSTDGLTTCNSCEGVSTIEICNQKRIYDTLMLRVQFKSDNAAAFTANSKLEIKVNGAATNVDVDVESSSSSLAANNTLTAAISWADLCVAMEMSGGCTQDQSSPMSVKFGINADSDADLEESVELKVQVTGQYLNDAPTDYLYHTPACLDSGVDEGVYEGFCDFKVFKGDKKVHIEDETTDPDTYKSTGQGTTFQYVRFYYEADTDTTCDVSEFATVTVNSKYTDISTTEESSKYYLSTHSIKGLKNGIGYYFRMANVDIAGNIFYFSGDDTAPVTHQHLTCEGHYAIPEEVEGLMTGKTCFIATAAFGTPMAPQIQTLRDFRDRFLITNPVGRWFTKKYYQYSPDFADWLKTHELAKETVRVILKPIISASSLALVLGGWATFFLFAFIFALAFFLFKKLKEKLNA